MDSIAIIIAFALGFAARQIGLPPLIFSMKPAPGWPRPLTKNWKVKCMDMPRRIKNGKHQNPLKILLYPGCRYSAGQPGHSCPGGSGANFLVKWKSKTKVNSPLIEGVMIGTRSGRGISFVSRGRVIDE